MSAIAGLFHLDGRPASPVVLARMLAALQHRGPDGRGTWHEGPAALGHLLLHTTPESLHEQQPYLHRQRNRQARRHGPLVLTADARIDNRAELRRRLNLQTHTADAPAADAAFILAAYEKWGTECPNALVGDFAFALWDARRRQLFCARDPMGVKPLYYTHRPGCLFAFASEIRPLLTLDAVTPRLNEAQVGDYLLRTLDRRSTFYEGIERLPAAHALTLSSDGDVRIHPYWSLKAESTAPPATDAACAEGFRARFDEAVRCRTRSAFPVGAALSGGLDSSSIAVVARDQLRQANGSPLHTFSALFPDVSTPAHALIDERPYIEAVLETGGFSPRRIRADRLGPLFDRERMHYHLEDTFRVPNLYLHWALFGAARRSGVRVFLDGLDGDATVSHGTERLAELTRQADWATLHAELDTLQTNGISSRAFYLRHSVFPQLAVLARQGHVLACLHRALNLRRQFGAALWPLLRGYILAPLLPDGLHQRLRRRRDGGPCTADLFIRRDFARRSNAWARRRAFTAAYDPAAAPTAPEAHRRALQHPLYQHMLEIADRAAAAFGLQGRYPFFDQRLIEYCVDLPAAQKLKDGWTRSVLRRALDGALPPRVQWRPRKADLSPNYVLRFMQDERSLLEEVLFSKDPAVARYVDLPTARTAYRRAVADPLRHREGVFSLYSITMLERWLHRSGLA